MHRILVSLIAATAIITVTAAAQTDERPTILRRARTAAPERIPAFQFAPQSFVSQERLTTNTYKDAEPSVITRQLYGVNYKVVAAIQQNSDSNFHVVVHTRGSNGSSADPQLPMPNGSPWTTGFLSNGDPLLGRSPTSANYRWVSRLYCVGTLNTGTGPFSVPSGIGLWYSDDGGLNWKGGPQPGGANPSLVAQNTSTTYYLDKPAIAVSQQISGGDVFVVYMRNVNTGRAEVRVARSTDGGETFAQDTCVDCTNRINGSPQVLFDDRNSVLYAIWVDYGFNQIKRAYSLDFGVTWSASAVVADITNGGTFIQATNRVHGKVAQTSPMARFNAVSSTINIVWHALTAAGDTDVYFATKSAGMPSWTVMKVAGATQTNDQWFPALDYDGSGYLLVSYYSAAEDTSGTNHFYRPKSVIIKSVDGTNVRGEEPATNDWNSPPGYLTDATGGTEATLGWIGDYHDVFYSPEYGRFFSAWIGWPSASDQHFEVFNYGLWY